MPTAPITVRAWRVEQEVTMRALIVTGPGQFSIQDMPLPVPGPYDALVKIDACAICTATDTHIMMGNFPWLNPYPFVLGHESTGIVEEIGVKVRRFAVGQRVTRPAAVLPGTTLHGISSNWGGYAEYGLVRDTQSAGLDGVASDGMLSISRVSLPDGVDPVSAALSINQREILSVVRRIPLDARSRVAVIGSGYNGLLFSLFCKHFGAGKVVMAGASRLTDRAQNSFQADALVDYRSPQAAEQICQALGGLPTHVIDAVGSVGSLSLAEELLAEGAAFGCYGLNDFPVTTDQRNALGKQTIPLDMGTDEPGTVSEWRHLWLQGFFDRPGIYDYSMPFEQASAAFAALSRREAVKIVLEV